jgi:hypothetical protein
MLHRRTGPHRPARGTRRTGRHFRPNLCQPRADRLQPRPTRPAGSPRCLPEGDALVVTKLDRPPRSLPDARAIADALTARRVRLSLGGAVDDPTDPVGRLLFNVLAMVAEFEADLIRPPDQGRQPSFGFATPRSRW